MKMSNRFKYIVDVKYGENRGQGNKLINELKIFFKFN